MYVSRKSEYRYIWLLGWPPLAGQCQSPAFGQNYYCRGGGSFRLTFLGDRLLLELPQRSPQTLSRSASSSETPLLYTNQQFTIGLEGQQVFLKRAEKIIEQQCQPSSFRPADSLRYDCTAQIAPFTNKENLSLRQAENLRLMRDGAFFIYHCFPSP